MIDKKLKELAVVKARIAILEKDVAAGLNKELLALPARYGFQDTKSFLRAVQRATSMVAKGEITRRPRKKRAVITDETRAEVRRLVEKGETGAAIAEILDISPPSVQNIKKALGLVRTQS